MKMIVGLGNPGAKYRETRHNVGFRVLEELARRHDGGKPKGQFEAEIVEINLDGNKTLLVAPMTYMNASGRSVGRLVNFYDLPHEDLLVICDDLNLEPAKLRLRPAGSSGGQKGLLDIIRHLGTESFARLRIGIGRPPGRMNAADYVLKRFHSGEKDDIEHAIMIAADAAERWVREGLDAAMNWVNAPTGH
ncbi:MAG: aminoacyl-tRNA hydrolase [Planctomycetaceae bacterium]